MKLIQSFIKAIGIGAMLLITTTSSGQEAIDIITKSEEKMRGQNSYAELKMTVVRPKWTREMSMKAWAQGADKSLIIITAPAREKGTAFLKLDKEVWNWQPSIDRVVKMPPSMMMQSWMGSDFSNDDLVRESSMVKDYTHKILGEETIEGRKCWKIELLAKDDAPVVWGKIVAFVDQEEYVQLKSLLYDEDDYLVSEMLGSDLKMFDGKLLASKMTITPVDDEGHKTIIEYIVLDFKETKGDDFYTVQNMKRVR